MDEHEVADRMLAMLAAFEPDVGERYLWELTLDAVRAIPERQEPALELPALPEADVLIRRLGWRSMPWRRTLHAIRGLREARR